MLTQTALHKKPVSTSSASAKALAPRGGKAGKRTGPRSAGSSVPKGKREAPEELERAMSQNIYNSEGDKDDYKRSE